MSPMIVKKLNQYSWLTGIPLSTKKHIKSYIDLWVQIPLIASTTNNLHAPIFFLFILFLSVTRNFLHNQIIYPFFLHSIYYWKIYSAIHSSRCPLYLFLQHDHTAYSPSFLHSNCFPHNTYFLLLLALILFFFFCFLCYQFRGIILIVLFIQISDFFLRFDNDFNELYENQLTFLNYYILIEKKWLFY